MEGCITNIAVQVHPFFIKRNCGAFFGIGASIRIGRDSVSPVRGIFYEDTGASLKT